MMQDRPMPTQYRMTEVVGVEHPEQLTLEEEVVT